MKFIFYIMLFIILLVSCRVESDKFKIEDFDKNILPESNLGTHFIDLEKLKRPTVFIVNEIQIEVVKFSDIDLKDKKIESMLVIQDSLEIVELGYENYNSMVNVYTKSDN